MACAQLWGKRHEKRLLRQAEGHAIFFSGCDCCAASDCVSGLESWRVFDVTHIWARSGAVYHVRRKTLGPAVSTEEGLALIYEAPGARLCQGGVFRDVASIESVEIEPASENNPDEQLSVSEVVLPYAVVLSQDCDLEQDEAARRSADRRNHDKFLSSILVCPAYPAEQVRLGIHQQARNLIMEVYDSKRWAQIKQNSHDRYHYLQEDLAKGIPELVIDFKHYRTISRSTLITQMQSGQALGMIRTLFRERLSQRFANYLSRIGLPDNLS